MPSSATGISTNRRTRACRGFSLLELLVVVTIIGLFAGVAVLSTGIVGNDREIEREMLRLRSLLDLVREEALMQTRDFGVLFTASGYRFYTYDYLTLEWRLPENDRLLREHGLPEELRVGLRLEDRDVVLDRDFERHRLEDPRPQVMLLSSGEITPFELTVERSFGSTRFRLTADLDGKLEIEEDGV